ncbi:aspartate/glutamate racemase family protein [Paenibacillus sp. S-38]|uniref:aspartate/glutamate racemase family protein n=1 Tax=Paenibacillus sp. S-38 TaxID=3416710 RepID=UPI003CF6B5A1
MKTIGLIGGLSYESTLLYYEHINKLINRHLGKTHSAQMILNSLDNEKVLALVEANDMDKVKRILMDAAAVVEQAGADCLLMCCNSVHKVADAVQQAVTIPLIHISDVVVDKISGMGLERIGLIGTNFTMSDSFYKSRLEAKSVAVLLPGQEDRDFMHGVIFNELVVGRITMESKLAFQRIIRDLIDRGAQGIILGCTEIPLLIHPDDVSVPVFDAALLHAEKAVEFVLNHGRKPAEIKELNPVV